MLLVNVMNYNLYSNMYLPEGEMREGAKKTTDLLWILKCSISVGHCPLGPHKNNLLIVFFFLH